MKCSIYLGQMSDFNLLKRESAPRTWPDICGYAHGKEGKRLELPCWWWWWWWWWWWCYCCCWWWKWWQYTVEIDFSPDRPSSDIHNGVQSHASPCKKCCGRSCTMGKFYIQVPQFYPVVIIPRMLNTSPRLFLSEGQAGGAWVPSDKTILFRISRSVGHKGALKFL